VNDITVHLTGCEGRLAEMQTFVATLEDNKRDLEDKLTTVSAILKEARSRPGTPTRQRSSSSSARRSGSPWNHSQSFSQVTSGGGGGGSGLDVDAVRGGVKELLNKLVTVEKERLVNISLNFFSRLKSKHSVPFL
jgi:hypothetical protein